MHSVGKVKQVFADVGVDRGHPGATNEEAIASTEALIGRASTAASCSRTSSRPTRSTATAATSRASTRRCGSSTPRSPAGSSGSIPARPARAHRRPRLRPDDAGLGPHPRARAAAGALRGPRRPPPRRPVRRRRRLRAALAHRPRRPRAPRASRSRRESPQRPQPPRSWRSPRGRLASGCGDGNKPAATPAPGSPAAKPAGAGGDLDAARAADAPPRRRARRRAPARLRRDRDRPAARARPRGGPQRARRELRDVELVVDSADVSGRRATLRVRSLYGVRGVRGRFGAARRLAARAHRARLARARRDRARRERHPWEVGPVPSPALAPLRRARAAPRSSSARLLDALEIGYARMGDVLRRPRLRRRYLVVVAGRRAAGALR